MNIALVFAGQGSQYIGMGKDFYKFDHVKKMYEKASNILNFDVASLCFYDNSLLSKTKYTQPCILTTSCAIYEVLKNTLKINPKVCAGFSLGEYTALYATKVFSFAEVVKLVKYRANFMDDDAKAKPGKMAAIIGLEEKILKPICDQIPNVQIANYNSPKQLVISGEKQRVDQVISLIKTKAKKIIPLNVSGAFHTPLMKNAANKIYEIIKTTKYESPQYPIITNYNALPLDIKKLPETLKAQIESPVLWIDTIKKMIEDYDIEMFVEIGPGKVLSGLIKKIDPSKKIININKLKDLELLKEDEDELRK